MMDWIITNFHISYVTIWVNRKLYLYTFIYDTRMYVLMMENPISHNNCMLLPVHLFVNSIINFTIPLPTNPCQQDIGKSNFVIPMVVRGQVRDTTQAERDLQIVFAQEHKSTLAGGFGWLNVIMECACPEGAELHEPTLIKQSLNKDNKMYDNVLPNTESKSGPNDDDEVFVDDINLDKKFMSNLTNQTAMAPDEVRIYGENDVEANATSGLFDVVGIVPGKSYIQTEDESGVICYPLTARHAVDPNAGTVCIHLIHDETDASYLEVKIVADS